MKMIEITKTIEITKGSASASDLFTYPQTEENHILFRHWRYLRRRSLAGSVSPNVSFGKSDVAFLDIEIRDPFLSAIPEFMSEEEFEAFLVQSGVIDELLSQLSATPRNRNWEDELDEL